MSYQLTIAQKPAYLHAIVSGTNSSDNVARYLEEIFRECAARDCRRVLIEEHLEGPRVGTMDVFEIASDGTNRARAFFRAIAYADVNARGDSMQFAATVAVNRGLPLKVFAAVAAAEAWLNGSDPGGESIARADVNLPRA